MRFGVFFLVYLVVGVLVAASVVGNEPSYFSGVNNLEEIVELVLAVLLWPLILFDVSINIGGGESGGGGSGGSGGGGDGGSGGSGGK